MSKSSKVASLNRLLPLVAIGTVADCQSITETTNRMLVKAGLQILQSGTHQIQGLTEIMIQTGLTAKINSGYQITSQDLGFTLSPILNSSGRISHARLSIATILVSNSSNKNKIQNSKFLIQENQEYLSEPCSELASLLINTNTERKSMVKDILAEVENDAKAQYQSGQKVLWLEGNWNKGIIGLLASRLVNQYNLPVIVVSKCGED
jgi:single-stranded-DNA-specific exonuclease